jgi:hypothetical protein
MKNNSEIVLPEIKLKYYKRSKNNKSGPPSGITCAWCLDKNIVKLGGGYRDEKGITKQICETCAIHRYKQDFGYKTLKAAAARRRRIFDVGYLFNEILMDVYMSSNNISDIKNFDKSDDLFIKAAQLYNTVFTKEEKIKIEELESQNSISDELQKRLFAVDLEKFFSDL